MNNKLQCATTIRNLATTYKDMVTAAEVLENLGSLEQAVSERERLLKNINEEIGKAGLQKVIAASELQSVKDAAKAAVEEGAKKAAEVVDQARKFAQQDHAKLMDKAHAEALEVTASALTAKDTLEAECGMLAEVKATLEAEVTSLNHAVSNKQAEVKELENRVAKAQAYIAKLQG